jgi:hypothetical protein
LSHYASSCGTLFKWKELLNYFTNKYYISDFGKKSYFSCNYLISPYSPSHRNSWSNERWSNWLRNELQCVPGGNHTVRNLFDIVATSASILTPDINGVKAVVLWNLCLLKTSPMCFFSI